MGRILNKRSQSGSDAIMAIATIFGLAIFCLIMVYTYSQFMDAARSTEVLNQSEQAIDAMESVENIQNMWDYVILVIFIGFAISIMVLGYFIDVHSVFMPIFILVLLIGVIVAGVLAYTWDQVADATVFTAIKTSHFPITNNLMSNLEIYFIIIGVLAMVVTYAKTRG